MSEHINCGSDCPECFVTPKQLREMVKELARLRAELKKFREFNNYEATAARAEAAEAKVAEWEKDFSTLSRITGGILGAEKLVAKVAALTKERDEARAWLGDAVNKAQALADRVAQMREVVEAAPLPIREMTLSEDAWHERYDLWRNGAEYNALSRLTAAPECRDCIDPTAGKCLEHAPEGKP